MTVQYVTNVPVDIYKGHWERALCRCLHLRGDLSLEGCRKGLRPRKASQRSSN